jgi:uncharacterized protein (DUF1501 family)
MCDDHKSSYSKKVNQYFRQRTGASLEDRQAHRESHQQWDRRSFLRTTGLVGLGSALMLGQTPVQALASSPLLNALSSSECGDRKLVLVRLKGGNDGLNTVILRGNDTYYNIRPTLAVQESGLWGLSPDYGMPNSMQALEPMWGDGKMKVIHNVGYPNPNYSHFRSSDIWASASDSDEVIHTGWIGRWMEENYPAFLSAPPIVPPALQIGIQANLVFRSNTANMALAISNPSEFYQIAQTGNLYSLAGLDNDPNDMELAYVRQVANSSFRYAESIQDAYNTGTNQVGYPNNNLAEQLAIVARLIKGDLGTKVFMVSIGGFDTHANQANSHPILLQRVANSIAAFFEDLTAGGQSQNVLAMTFSEFGRTIYENGSFGTDHGTGAPMMIFGDDLGSEFIGEAPDLDNLDQYGDPLYSVDFREVYSSVLQDWLCVPPQLNEFVLGDGVTPIPGILPAGNPPIGSNQVALLLGHKPIDAGFAINYAIKRRGNVRLVILNKQGQQVRTLFQGFRERGSYTFDFHPSAFFLSPGSYFYRLESGGMAYSRQIKW